MKYVRIRSINNLFTYLLLLKCLSKSIQIEMTIFFISMNKALICYFFAYHAGIVLIKKISTYDALSYNLKYESVLKTTD